MTALELFPVEASTDWTVRGCVHGAYRLLAKAGYYPEGRITREISEELEAVYDRLADKSSSKDSPTLAERIVAAVPQGDSQ